MLDPSNDNVQLDWPADVPPTSSPPPKLTAVFPMMVDWAMMSAPPAVIATPPPEQVPVHTAELFAITEPEMVTVVADAHRRN